MKASSARISLLALSFSFLANASLSSNAQAMVEDELARIVEERQRAYQGKKAGTETSTQKDLNPEKFQHNITQIYENFFIPEIKRLEKRIIETQARLEKHCHNAGKPIPQSLEEKLFFQEDTTYLTLSHTLKSLRECFAYRMEQRNVLLETVQSALERILKVLHTHPNLINIADERLQLSDKEEDEKQQRYIVRYTNLDPQFSRRVWINNGEIEKLIEATYHFLTSPLRSFEDLSIPFTMAMDLSQTAEAPQQKKKALKTWSPELRRFTNLISTLRENESLKVIEENRRQVEEEYKRETWFLFCAIAAHYKKQYQRECINEMIGAGLNADIILQLKWSFAYMLHTGWTPADMLKAGWKKEHMKRANWSISDLANAGWTKKEMEQAGWTLQDAKEDEWQGKQLSALGWSIKELLEKGYTFQDLLDIGYPPENMKSAGYTLNQQDVHDTRISLGYLLGDGWTLTDIRQAGLMGRNFPDWWNFYDFIESKVTLEHLRQAGLSANTFKKAGISLEDLLKAEWTLEDLIASGWPTAELKEAGWTNDQLIHASWSTEEAQQTTRAAEEELGG